MKLKWHLLIAAFLIASGLIIWGQVLQGSITASTGIPIRNINIHIFVDIPGIGALVGALALIAGSVLLISAVARAFLIPD